MKPELPTPNTALFLDVDGTLLDFAERPDGVVVPEELPALLAAIERRLGGALALVSGRPVAVLDALFAPQRFAAAGIHGVERRDAEGRWHFAGPTPEELGPARAILAAALSRCPGLVLEDKGRSLALHYRLVPHCAAQAAEAAAQALEALGAYRGDVQALPGNHVFEIKSTAATKGTAVESFLREPPFVGRVPMMLGDDVTDEDGFAAVESAGGRAVCVGAARGTLAAAPWRASLEGPAEVRAWLMDAARPHREARAAWR